MPIEKAINPDDAAEIAAKLPPWQVVTLLSLQADGGNLWRGCRYPRWAERQSRDAAKSAGAFADWVSGVYLLDVAAWGGRTWPPGAPDREEVAKFEVFQVAPGLVHFTGSPQRASLTAKGEQVAALLRQAAAELGIDCSDTKALDEEPVLRMTQLLQHRQQEEVKALDPESQSGHNQLMANNDSPLRNTLKLLGGAAGTAAATKLGQAAAAGLHHKLAQTKLGEIHPVLPVLGAGLATASVSALAQKAKTPSTPAPLKALLNVLVVTGASGAVSAGTAVGSHLVMIGSQRARELAAGVAARRAAGAPASEEGPTPGERMRNVTPKS